jgi:hypothetical protein
MRPAIAYGNCGNFGRQAEAILPDSQLATIIFDGHHRQRHTTNGTFRGGLQFRVGYLAH